MSEMLPGMRRDLEFFPIQYGGEQLVLIRDHLGLVQEGKAIPVPMYQLMTLLDGSMSMVDLQTFLMRQGGGVLVGREEIQRLLAQLDDSFLLDSPRFMEAKRKVVSRFAGESIRSCSHVGSAYPADPDELRKKLEEVLSSGPAEPIPALPPIRAVVSPHIDLNAGKRGYANAYNALKGASPSRVVLLGIGHRLADGLFSLTEKDFKTPLGTVRSDKPTVQRLRSGAPAAFSQDDFIHRSEHSIEFQVLFLQHLLPEESFSIVPILCGSIQSCVPEYRRTAYLEKAGGFLGALHSLLEEDPEGTLLIAGVDFSHIGMKFGHQLPASSLEPQARAHDGELLNALCGMDADGFWGESARVGDRFNVCGFSALACLLEVLPGCRGEVLSYECWHEEPTRSAVSFASMVFRSKMKAEG
jgi:AmmeMemoRadiSam system protein B